MRPEPAALGVREEIRPIAAVGLGLADMAAQRLGAHAQISGDLRDRPAALKRQPHATGDQFVGVLLRTGHDDRLPLLRTEILV